MKKTTKPQAKPTDWEAVRMLAIELVRVRLLGA